MTFSKYKKTVIACALALGIGVSGGYFYLPVNINKTKDSYSSVVPVMRFTIHGIAVLLLFLSCQVDMPLPKNSTLSRKLKA